jgi:hypothetical protein
MKKIISTIGITATVLASHYSHANVGVTVTLTDTDYVIGWASPGNENYDAASNDFLDSSFSGRDLTLDYSFDNQQVGIKIGGLSEESDIFPEYELQPGESNSAKRDEWTLFYTYRFDNGWSLTGGYYDSTFSIEDNFSISLGDGTTGLVNTDFDIENSGYFVGASYVTNLTDNFGAFFRLAVQTSDNSFNLLNTLEGFDDFSDSGSTSGTATVFGTGVYYVLGENSVITLFYDAKNFSYDEFTWESGGSPISYEEDMSSLGLSLRYSL